MAKLQVGDVVMLKSGGPKMTVSALNNNGSVRCAWFNMNDQTVALGARDFPEAVLDIAQPDGTKNRG